MPTGSTGTGTEGALLGRRDQLAELRAGLGDVRGGRGRLFLLAGEGGIGKTALLEALIEEAQPTDVRAVVARCREPRASPPWWPWAQVLGACLRDAPDGILERYAGTVAADLAQVVPDLPRWLPGVTPRPPSESPDARLRLFDAIRDFIAEVAAEGGLIVGLDDLHAADEGSLRLLQHLAGELSSSNVLLVGTYRDAEVRSAPHLHRLVTAIARHGRRIVLSGLDETDVATLLESMVTREMDAGLVQEVYLTTDGNPLFVQEVARLLEDGPDSTALGLAEEIHRLIRQRLEPLPSPARDVLDLAAVINRPFDAALLKATLGFDDAMTADAVERCMASDVIARERPGRWSFAHDVGREAVYDGIRASRRVALHRRVGEALVERVGTVEGRPHVAELAHHFFEAARGGEATEARRHCALAGGEAMAALAFEEASVQFGRALEALTVTPPVDERRRYELLTRLADAHVRLGDLAQGREFQRRALKSARALGAADLLAEAAVRFSGEPGWFFDETGASVLAEARAALPEHDSEPRAKVLVTLAATARTRQECVQLSGEALAMARRLGGRDTLQWVLTQWHRVNRDDPNVLQDRLAVADELVRLSEEAADPEGLQRARLWRAQDLFFAGDIAGMAAELVDTAQHVERLRLPSLTAARTLAEATLALLQGRLDEAEDLARHVRAAGERAPRPDIDDDVAYRLYALCREQGRGEEMATIARHQLDSVADGVPITLRRALVALALAEMGKSEEAREELSAVAGDLLRPGGWGGLAGAAVVADVSWLIGEGQWAEATYERLLCWPNRHVVVGAAAFSLGASDRYLGQMATLLERLDDAGAHFESAHRLHETLGTPGWAAHGRADHARMLLTRGCPGDAETARQLVATALDTYRTLGMVAHHERTATWLDAPSPRAVDAEAEVGVFALEGEYWAIAYGGAEARIRDSKGLRYLSRLLQAPGQEHHALDLVVGEGQRGRMSPTTSRQEGLDTLGGGDAGVVLDAKAKAAYKRRLADLQEEVEEATRHHDIGRVEKAQREIDFLMAELAAAVGLGGRDRKAASDAERARQSVTRAIKGAVERIATAHPALGDHLRTTVHTGIYSSYAPDPRAPIRWRSK